MNKLKHLIIHCSDTPFGRDVTKEDIMLWHTGSKSKGHRGWSKPGYSDIITIDAKLVNLIPYNEDDYVQSFEISNGAKGYNLNSRHVCMIGGWDEYDNKNQLFDPWEIYTVYQINTLIGYIKTTVKNHPDIKVGGHNIVSKKTCPNFDVKSFLLDIGVDENNIL